MRYPGFCAKYGQNKMVCLSYSFGAAASMGVDAALGGHYGLGLAAMMGIASGSMAVLTATVSHGFSNIYCSDKSYGISCGGDLVKKVQAASYAAMLAACIGTTQYLADDILGQEPDAEPKTTEQLGHKQPALEDLLHSHSLKLAA